jgi:GNAT superfamily N-acetyltransferase
MESMLIRVAAHWCAQTGVSAAFEAGRITVVTAASSRTAPPGWIGTVRLADAALMTAPTDEMTQRVRGLVADLSTAQVCDPELILASLRPVEILGPATLSYLDPIAYRPVATDAVTEIDAGSDIDALVAAAGDDDADESGIREVTSPIFGVRAAGGVTIAACGYRTWLGTIAHMGVLVHPDHRGHGLAKAVASAATAHALAAGLIPQWRARPVASIAVARTLGYTRVGDQVSFRLS